MIVKSFAKPALFREALAGRDLRGFSVFNVLVLWETRASVRDLGARCPDCDQPTSEPGCMVRRGDVRYHPGHSDEALDRGDAR